MRLIIISIMLLIFSSGCEPYKYLLNKKKEYRLRGYKMTEMDDVRQIGDNAIAIDSNALTAIGTFGMTNFLADFTVKLHSGTGIRFYFRTIEHNFESHPNINIDYTTGGTIIRRNNIIIDRLENIKANIGREERIRILNDAADFMLMIDCDTVYTGRTSLPNTEYIMLETHPRTQATVFGINFEEVYEFDLPYFEDKIF